MKIIILATRLPYPQISGGIKRIVSICEHLRDNGHTLTLLTFINSKDDERNIAEGKLDYLFDDILHVKLGIFMKFYNLVTGLLSHKPLQVLLFRSKKMRNLIKKINETNPQDISICHMIRASEYQVLIKADRKLIELTDSLSLNFARKTQNYGDKTLANFVYKFIYSIEAKRLKEAEIECLETNDKVVLVSDVDRDFILAERKEDDPLNNKLTTIPLGIPDEFFSAPLEDYDPHTIVFVGKMDYEPNEKAVIHFVKYILPLVKLIIPNVRFKIVGAVPSDRVKKLSQNDPSITVTGRVDSIIDHVSNAALSVALMQSGAGMQTKILESLALGVPVVTNKLGLEGIDLVPNVDLMVAADDNEAAKVISDLISNRTHRQKLSIEGQKAVFNKYSSSKIFTDYIS